jgi:phosphoserine phosphatase
MHLVIQGLDVETTDLKAIAKLAGASRIENIGPQAFRLHHASRAEGIGEICERAALDHAFIPEERRLADVRLLAMDMDSTLITIETVDELADLAGFKPQVAEITARAMRGEIEYDESLRRRVALLTGLDERALSRVYDERVKLSPGAESLIATAKRLGIRTLLVSGGFDYITDRLQSRLGLDRTRANRLEIRDGKLTGELVGTIVNADGKRKALLAMCAELKIAPAHVIAIGDGANDLKFMAEAGVSIAYRAKPVVRAQATHAINHVGLDGALHLFN